MPQSCRKIWNIPRLSDEVENYNLLVQLPAGVLLRARKPVYARLVLRPKTQIRYPIVFGSPRVLGSFIEIQAPAPNVNFLRSPVNTTSKV